MSCSVVWAVISDERCIMDNKDLINNVVVDEDVTEQETVTEGTVETSEQATDESKAEVEVDTKSEDESKETDSQGETAETDGQTQEKPLVQVPISVVQKERQKRQELQRQLEEMQVLLVQKEADKQTQEQEHLDPNDPDPLASIEDDDWDMMLPSEQRKAQFAHEAWGQRENARQNQVVQNQHYQQLDQIARQEFTVEKMGDMLDYDSVVKSGKAWLDKDDCDVIKASLEPHREFYNRCLTKCPHLRKPSQTAKAGVAQSATQQTAQPATKTQTKPPSNKEVEPEHIEYDDPLDELTAGVVIEG